MTLQEDMDSQRNWTQDQIDGLKQKHSRTHFTHFPVCIQLKPAPRKVIRGVLHKKLFGRWVPESDSSQFMLDKLIAARRGRTKKK